MSPSSHSCSQGIISAGRKGKLSWRVRGRSMTYIAAFRCDRGIVLCADTQETRGDYKSYVEKISIIEDRLYPLAIGGAGVADIIDGVTQEIIERITSARPATVRELKDLIRASVQEFYEKDVPLLV